MVLPRCCLIISNIKNIQHMKKALNLILFVSAILAMQSCSATRSASGPGGAVAPASGSASNISSGHSVSGTPRNDQNAVADSTLKDTSGGGGTGGITPSIAPADSSLQFINVAAVSSLAEIQLSKLAISRAQSAAVKDFATIVVKDHTKANNELKALAIAKNIELPNLSDKNITDGVSTEVGVINQNFELLKNADKAKFDKQYIEIMMQDHQKAVEVFGKAALSYDPVVKTYASKYLPVLRIHLKEVTALNSQL